MAKKSSASSATRKKHAAKKLGEDNEAAGAQQPAQRGQKKAAKKSRFEPKIKSYTPPPAPPKGAPDPVDLYLGRGSEVDPELVVILRKLAKRDEATISKGVEGLDAWARDLIRSELTSSDDPEPWKLERRREELVSSIAVWAHHFPRLSLHPSRRLRLQTHTLHALLASSPSLQRPSQLLSETRSALLAPLWVEQIEYVGAWCCSAFDTDRAVRNSARRSWDAVVLRQSSTGEDEREGIILEHNAQSIITFANSLALPPASHFVEENDEPSLRQTQAILAISYLLETLPSPLPLKPETLEILTKPDIWELLVPEQPAMLRRSIYDLLGSIVERKDDELIVEEEALQTIAGWVLRNCWAEADGWAGVIAFLRRYPQAWTLADEPLTRAHVESVVDSDEENVDADEDATEESSEAATPTAMPSSSTFIPSPTLALFCSHLAAACTGHPSSYPTILLVLSTLPDLVLPPALDAVSLLLESFWAAWGSRPLIVGSLNPNAASTSATEEFVASILECLVWQVSRLAKAQVESHELLKEWIGRVWRTYLGIEGESKLHKTVATARVVAQLQLTLTKLVTRSEDLLVHAWSPIRTATLEALSTPTLDSLPCLSSALVAFTSATQVSISKLAQSLAIESVNAAVDAVRATEEPRSIASHLSLIESLRAVIASDAPTSQMLDELVLHYVISLLQTPASTSALHFLTQHLAATSPTARATIWDSLFTTSPTSLVLLQLVQAVADGVLPSDFASAGLDDTILEAVVRVLGDARDDSFDTDYELVTRLMIRPEPFISTSAPLQILALVTGRLADVSTRTLSSTPPRLARLSPPARILAHFCADPASVTSVRSADFALVGVVALSQVAYLMSDCRLEEDSSSGFVEARRASESAWAALVANDGASLVTAALERFSEQLIDTDVTASPIELVRAAAALLATSRNTSAVLSDLLPPLAILKTLRSSLELLQPSPALSILEPLVTSTADRDGDGAHGVATDLSGFSAYVRVVVAVLEIAARDHAWARKSVWLLPHLLLVADCARDELAIAGSTCSLFSESISSDTLDRLVTASDGLFAYILSSVANDLPSGWHASTVSQLRSKDPLGVTDTLLGVLDSLGRQARISHAVYARRAFCKVVQTTLRYTEGSVVDAERWLAFAQSLDDVPAFASAIVVAVKGVIVESPRFVRYQNETASTLAGVPSAQASTRGETLLRSLLSTAPPLDAPVIFLPQQRTMFLIQRIQSWISSTDRIGTELQSLLAELFLHLAPIVQELSGSHWDLFFDTIEFNLEIASWGEDETLPALWNSVRLLAQIKDLAVSNAELRLTVKSRIDASLELVRDLFVSRPDSRGRNVPRSMTLDIMARLVTDLPEKLLVMGPSFDKLLGLLRDESLPVQQSAYQLICKIAQKHVADLVVEVELESESTRVLELPAALISLLSTRVSEDALESTDELAQASTFLLSWLVAFQFFDTASPRIKSAYLDQLRQLDLVAVSLLPSLFALLSVSDRTRSFDVSAWAVDDFHLELFDGTSSISLAIFATFLYYRALQAVPSLIRSWWESCKNRQLSMAVATFTSRHFSPVLIAQELAHLRDPDDPAGRALRDNEDFTVKVATGANEVKAVFIIDEQSMEISIRIPSDFPLQGVEVKDVKKIGVTDAQWRAWLLAVQQVVTNQNGLIADALSLFKRNVSLHFEGVEACAICYSVISVVDRSLPAKACRTCNNRFHAGCLYKWFSTSHGSSCPLCRSLF